MALASSSVACDNPCDPYCRIYNDDAGGLDGAMGTNVIVGAGISIAPGCQGLQLGASPETVVVTSIDPITTDPPSVQFAPQLLPAGCCSETVPAAWAVDKPDVATVNEAGILSVYAPVATRLAITAFTSIWRSTTQLDLRVNVFDTSRAPSGTADVFGGPGTVDDDFVWLYPYSKTVLPLNLDAPVLQWDDHGVYASAVKIGLRYPAAGTPVFEWSTVVPETYPPRSTSSGMPGSPNAISPAVWSAFERTARGQDAILSIQRLVGGVLRREVTRVIHFADGGLRGRVYYTQYSRDVFGRQGPAQVAKLEPNVAAEPVNPFGVSIGCPVCHSVSANGATFVASDSWWSVQGGVSAVNPDGTLRWVADAPQYPGTSNDDDHRGFAWAALTPDGRYALQGDHFWGNTRYEPPAGTSPDNGTGNPYAIWQVSDGSRPSTPTLVGHTAETNWGLGNTVMMVPSFSPDGRKLAFIDGDGAAGAGWRKGLSTFDFDPVARVFSHRKLLYSTWGSDGWDAGGNVLKWPAFEPDSRSVLFMQSTPDDLCSRGACIGNTLHGYGNIAPSNLNTAKGTIWSIDSVNPVENPPVFLDNLNSGEGDVALRRPIDVGRSYQPTSLPTASAGYRWVMFSSTRPYGNTQNSSGWPSLCLASQLWVAAMDDAPSARTDRSYPAFWLPRQLHTDVCYPFYANERAVWVLDACKTAGSECGSASECCQPPASQAAMDCRIDDPTPPARRHCVAAVRAHCAAEGEACTQDSDCCGSGIAVCIGLRCRVAPGPATYEKGTFVRDFIAECSAQELPIWRFFDWQTVTPGDSQIVFSARTAEDQAKLDSATPVYLATARGASGQGFSEENGVDVDEKLQSVSGSSQANLRIVAELIPSSDRRNAPALIAWRQSFDCVPSK